MSDLAGKLALVTASSRGLGLACAQALLERGADVCINGRDRESLDATLSSLRALAPGQQVRAVLGDLGQAETRRRLKLAVPTPDILVLNVGGPAARPLAVLADDDWREAFESLYLPAADLLQHYLPELCQRGWGRVVAITSAAVRAPLPGLATSTVNRLALSGLLHCHLAEAMTCGVTINAILPGRILTPRQQAAIRREADKAGIAESEQLERWLATIPAGRLGRADEVGALCAFLAGPAAGYITGQHIVIDGGASATLF